MSSKLNIDAYSKNYRRIPAMNSTVSKYETSLNILTQIFTVDMAFVCCMALDGG